MKRVINEKPESNWKLLYHKTQLTNFVWCLYDINFTIPRVKVYMLTIDFFQHMFNILRDVL